jgi:hypothetical protein
MRQESAVVRFPPRRAHCVRIVRDAAGGWLVIAYSHGWLHGNRRAAIADAQWLARNLKLPVREAKIARHLGRRGSRR